LNTPDGLWEVQLKPEPANPANAPHPASEQARVEIKLSGHQPSFYNPFDGEFHGPSEGLKSHLPVDLEC